MEDPYCKFWHTSKRRIYKVRTWTLDLTTIEKRLLNDLTPSTLEHLIVSLLQLEHPDEVWTQVGGSGDGGVDGAGSGQDGHVTGLLQSKWQYWEKTRFLPIQHGELARSHPKIFAALRYPDGAAPPHCIFLNRPRIAELVAKHYLNPDDADAAVTKPIAVAGADVPAAEPAEK